ncbi:MAG TPA: hypothetical protein VGQ04_10630 [Chitinophagaceae bacterium]|nr:hypothetical protein [Chitinophagaceae bacterium]
MTGNDILTFNGSTQSVPDSIKLWDIRTGYSYPLFIGLGVNESEVYSLQYKRPANIIDTLEFKFGNKFDTLFVHTGIVDGWRGDECGSVKEPGIIKVVLRNQVLIETTYDIAIFTLKE